MKTFNVQVLAAILTLAALAASATRHEPSRTHIDAARPAASMPF